MKTLPYLIVAIASLILGILIMKSCQEPEIIDRSDEIKELQAIALNLEKENQVLALQRDSLLKVIPEVITQIIYRERKIDENIAKDSSNALVEYRRSLQDNQEIPDGSNSLTLREIGLGAKLMAKIPKLELTIKTYENVIKKDNEIFKNYDFQIKGYEDLNKMQNLEIAKWRNLYKDETVWYKSNYLYYGLGIITAVAIVFATGAVK